MIRNLEKKRQFVNHYSFHIMDPAWGHLTIKMSGHPPFAAQVILNGHEYVACQAQAAGIGFTKEGNCFTRVDEPERLAQVADTLSQPGTAGRLGQVIDRWIYTACLCFGLDLAEQRRSGFRYAYSVYQVEYSRNLLFRYGAVMDRVFDAVMDRTRSRLDVPTLRTLFGANRPRRPAGTDLRLQAAVIERPRYDLTIFKVHFGLLTLKGYTKGEHVLRFEAITHNTKTLGCGRMLEKFPAIVARLAGMAERFSTILDCVDVGFIPDGLLDQLPPRPVGATRVGGVDVNRPAHAAALAAVLALALAPTGSPSPTSPPRSTPSPASDPLHRPAGRLRPAQTARQEPRQQTRPLPPLPRPAHAARTIAALLTLREHVIAPILAGVRSPGQDGNPGPTPASTATTRPSASTCTPCSATSASTPPA